MNLLQMEWEKNGFELYKGVLYKINQDLITRCTDYYKDFGADSYPDDLYSAKRNAKKKCD
jgi:hypothetical protein